MDKDENNASDGEYLNMDKFHISREFGFVLPEPLYELPKFYQPWMDIANNLPQLIELQQLRHEVNKMELLDTHLLIGHKQLRLAHLALSFITMGYVWQEGEQNSAKVLPKNLVVPFCKVSEIIGLPPILVHADCVLSNWKKKDPSRGMELRNLDTIFTLPGGSSLKGFFLVTLQVELAAVQGIKAIATATEAVWKHEEDSIKSALQDVAASIRKMNQAFRKMDVLSLKKDLFLSTEYVDPAAFYGTIRLFLSGWKDNPAVPDGLLYEGVWEDPRQFSGGSAAQSSTLQSFDEFLGVRHNEQSAAFLHRMRDYMPPAHKAFIQAIASGPPVREYIISHLSPSLREGYNDCIQALVSLRSYHITVVTRYIMIPAAGAKAKKGKLSCTPDILQKAPTSLEERGTGGSIIMSLLKSARDATKEMMIKERGQQ